jgi:hypothetical protein
MNRRIVGTLATVLAAIVVAVGGAGVAYGYWTSGGSGTATAGTGNTVPVTLTAGSPTAGLFPGGTSSVVLTISNPNTAAVQVNSLALNTTQGTGGFAVDAAHSGCTLSALSFVTQSNGGSGWTIPAKVGTTNGTLAVTLGGALAMATSAANACQGATFTVYLVAG